MIRIVIRNLGAAEKVRDFRQTSVRIGRRPENDVALASTNVSGYHGEIRTTRDGLVFHDLESTNGSFVRRKSQMLRVDGEMDHRLLLQPGDQLLFGEPSAPVVLEPEFVGDGEAGGQEVDTNIELAQVLDAADSQVLRGLPEHFDQSALLHLHQFTERLLAQNKLDDMLTQFADSVLSFFSQAERVSVYLQGEGEDYYPVLSRDRKGNCPYEAASRTLERVVLERGQAVLFSAADQELHDAESLRRSNICVGLAAPLRDGKKTFGFAQADSRFRLVPFQERDLQVFAVISRQLALSVSNLQLNEGLAKTVRDLEQAREDMERLAFEDALTGLANRRLFRDRLEQSMRMRRRAGGQAAVLYVDLDNFKRVNDSLGHDAGDELLRAMAKRLASCVREPDTVARLGGDEFALLLPEVNGADGARRVAQKVLATVRQPVTLRSEQLIVTTSVGITLAPEDGVEAESLLRNADMALYRAKQQGRDNAQFFDEEMKREAAARLSLEGELRTALERGELRLHYQPVWRPGESSPCAAEALVRWQHPRRGLLMPDGFIELAEESGLIVPLGEWVLGQACARLAGTNAGAARPFRISINLSPRQLLHAGLIDQWRAIVDASGADAAHLQVEITETTLMENLAEARRVLQALRELGMSIAIDDFGTGYSSLAYLKELPIDTLKIDQRFVQGIDGEGGDAAIAAAILAMASKLGLSVVGEGVETATQLEFLERNQCDEVQGFLLGHPQDFDPAWVSGGS